MSDEEHGQQQKKIDSKGKCFLKEYGTCKGKEKTFYIVSKEICFCHEHLWRMFWLLEEAGIA